MLVSMRAAEPSTHSSKVLIPAVRPGRWDDDSNNDNLGRWQQAFRPRKKQIFCGANCCSSLCEIPVRLHIRDLMPPVGWFPRRKTSPFPGGRGGHVLHSPKGRRRTHSNSALLLVFKMFPPLGFRVRPGSAPEVVPECFTGSPIRYWIAHQSTQAPFCHPDYPFDAIKIVYSASELKQNFFPIFRPVVVGPA